MSFQMTIHYDNGLSYADPYVWVWYTGSDMADDFAATGSDIFGRIFAVDVKRQEFQFKFKDGPGVAGPWEIDALNRSFRPLRGASGQPLLNEIWCRADKAFVYPVLPRSPEAVRAVDYLAQFSPKPGVYFPETDGRSGLGATLLTGGGALFGLYHPNAARVYVFGSFNGWQRPGDDAPDAAGFHELALYSGYFDIPNLWLGVVPNATPGDEYKFCVQGGVPTDEKGRFQQYITDPYARQLGPNFGFNNSVVVDPTTFNWTDSGFQTPDRASLILYEMSVYGFTEGDSGISQPGRFAGVTERIRSGYFNELGVTALSLMPLAEFSGPQGPTTLGYSSSVFCAVERDFGAPDDLRELVNEAHKKGLTVILDQVFNHTSNDINPLWKSILEHPTEEFRTEEGGLYFSGGTPWGNRVATEKWEVQTMLIDTCKLLLTEYHVDGFRFDATHTNYMDHEFLLRLAQELTNLKPSVILIAENLPNQIDLNRAGYDGFSQWSDPFHDKMKALLREDVFNNSHFYNADQVGDIFYFAKSLYAAHTNNVVNYVESHDETSVPYEVGTNPATNQPVTKERKGRLGLFATIGALGQPMIYMGQEFNVERDRNIVSFQWPTDGPTSNGFYRWASRLIRLRRRYPALQVSGDNPAGDGRFTWILGPWMDERHGRGRIVLGWRVRPNQVAHETMVVILNFERSPVRVDLELGRSGRWVKLADLDNVNDIPPDGTNSADDPTALRSVDGRFSSYEIPSSSGFLYKWERGLPG